MVSTPNLRILRKLLLLARVTTSSNYEMQFKHKTSSCFLRKSCKTGDMCQPFHFNFSCFIERFYLFERVMHRQNSLSTGSLPIWLHQLWLSQAEVRKQELLLGSPYGWQSPNTCATFCCFSQAITRELDLKWNSQTQISPHRMLVLPGWLYLLATV